MTIGYCDPQSVYAECRRRGFRLTVKGEYLVARGPKAAMDDALADAIARHKQALGAMLTAREARSSNPPEVDPALTSFYPDGVPRPLNDAVQDAADRLYENSKPLGDAAAAVMDRLYEAGRPIRCDDPYTVQMHCPTCRQATVSVCEGLDDDAQVVLACDCGPTRLLQLLKGIKATIYYWPAPRHARAVQATCCGCGCDDWWLSVYGVRICRVCHPPVHDGLEQPQGPL